METIYVIENTDSGPIYRAYEGHSLAAVQSLYVGATFQTVTAEVYEAGLTALAAARAQGDGGQS